MSSSSADPRARIPSTFGDQGVHIIARYFVPEIQLVVDLDDHLDERALAASLRRLLEAEPVLGCAFVPRTLRPYWRRLTEAELDRAELLEVARVPADELADAAARDRAVGPFLARPLRHQAGPQVRALLVQAGAASRLALKVSHLPADTAATKQVGYALAAIHRRALAEPTFAPAADRRSRRLRQAFARLGPADVPALIARAAATQLGLALRGPTLRFPVAGRRAAAGATPAFVLRHFDGARVAGLKAWGRRRGATLNDLFAAAALRALVRLAGWDGRSHLRLKTTIDLRRYLADREGAGLCNLSSFLFVGLGAELGEGFEETLARVKVDLDAAKADDAGLGYLLLLRLLGAGLPFAAASASMRAFQDTQLAAGTAAPCFTNLGAIDLARLDFGGARARAAFVVAPAIQPPDFGFGLSGDGIGLTLSCGFFEPSARAAEVERYFALLDEELPGGARGPVLSSTGS